MVPAAALLARGVVGDVVLRRPRRARGPEAAHAGAARGPRAVPRHAAAARAAACSTSSCSSRRSRRSRCPIARAKRTEQLGLLTKLASQVDPEFKPFARRGERTAAAGTVDAIVGFAKIASYLRDEERNPVDHADSGKSYGGTMELAVFGRIAQRGGPHPRAGAAPPRDVRGARRPVGSEGRVADRLPADRADERRERGHARHARPRIRPHGQAAGRSASCGGSSG